MTLKSKYASGLLVEIGHSIDEDKAQEYLDMVTPSVVGMSSKEMLCMIYEMLQSVPYRSAEQDAEADYHISKALKEIVQALEKID